MPVVRTRTFRSGNSEAVRLPKGIAFGRDVELVLVRSGEVVTMYPVTTTVAEMLTRLATLPAPSAVDVRDEDPTNERNGL
jgi:antitoxin VapB